jgi:PAS domain S-box-containing protein
MQYANIRDEDKTKDQLIGELADLRHLIAELERSEAERKGAERALRESEERFRKLSEASFEGIVIHENGRILDANQTFADMLGYELSEVIGMSETDVVVAEHRDLFLKSIQSEHEKTYEAVCLRKDGITFTCRFRGKAIPYQGRNVGVSALRDVSERRKAEKEIKRSEKKYKLLVNNLTNPITLYDLNGLILLINKAGAKNLGGKPKDFIGKSHHKLFPAMAFTFDERIRQISVSKKGARFEDLIELPSGEKRWFWSNLQPVKDVSGKINAIQTISYDITEHKLYEEVLRESKRFLQDILDSIQDGVSVLDSNLNIIRINATMEKLYSHQVPFIGKKCYEVYHDLTKPCEVCPTLRTLSSGKKDFEVVHYKGPEGDSGWLELFTFPLINSKTGDKAGVIEYVRNISDRKRAEEALKESETKYRNLFVHMLDGFAYHKILVNENNQPIDYVFLEVNDAFERLTGLKRKNIIGEKITEVIPGIRESSFDWISAYGIVALTGEEFRAEQFSEALGKWYSISAYSPKKGYFVAIFMDITERKDAERKLKMFADDLQRSNLELEQFASIASHDLQDPLVSMACSLKLLKRHSKGRLDPDSYEFITNTIDKTNQMQTLVRNLLAYSRLGTRRKKFKPSDCVKIFKKAIANLESAIQQYGAVVTHDDLPEVRGNATQLVQLFQNLISNAIKFRDKEPPLIHISAKRNENEWVFSVRDNGIGIESRNIDDIFNIFHQLHDAGEYPGSGIGLSICKKIVEHHGGRIWVESEHGKGSIFYFTIPDRRHNKS